MRLENEILKECYYKHNYEIISLNMLPGMPDMYLSSVIWSLHMLKMARKFEEKMFEKRDVYLEFY